MNKEIEIKRSFKITIKYVIVMFIVLLIISWPLVWSIIDFESFKFEFEGKVILLLLCSIFAMPVIILVLVIYLKNLFDKTPILVINDDGLHERMRIRKIGLIKWEDIEKIKIKKDVLDNDFICIYFKEPEKYINNEKELKRIRLKGSNCNYGHVFFTSLYFKKQLKDVIESIQYYFAKYNDKTL